MKNYPNKPISFNGISLQSIIGNFATILSTWDLMSMIDSSNEHQVAGSTDKFQQLHRWSLGMDK